MNREVRNIDGKVVGQINDGVLQKKVFKKKHFMKILNGWGMDKGIFEEDFTKVMILDKDEDVMYVSDKETWLTKGIHKNFGHGDQIILQVKHHEIRTRKQPQLL